MLFYELDGDQRMTATKKNLLSNVLIYTRADHFYFYRKLNKKTRR